MTLRLEGTIVHPRPPAEPYVYVPFDVPVGTSRIDVRYDYDASSILDLGLLDPRASEFPTTLGFRGWSGSARHDVFVASDGATPGYIGGELPAGRWHLMLGVARLATEGCRFEVAVDVEATPRGAAAVRPAPTFTPRGPGWYRGDLHTHTHHSDARGSLADLVAAARTRRLDFLAVTDHNTWSHHDEARAASRRDLLVFPGEEVTTYRGHANVWGVDGWTDFRIGGHDDVHALARHVHARGGLLAVNHPRRAPGCIGCDWELPVPEAVDLFEVWNGPWAYRNWESLDRCDALLRAGRRLVLVGGSDRHQPGWPDTDPRLLWVGTPTTWFQLPHLSESAVLSAMDAGTAFVSEGPEGPTIELYVDGVPMGRKVAVAAGALREVEARVKGARGDRLRYVAADGVARERVLDDDDVRDRWVWEPTGPFLRAEVVASDDPVAVGTLFDELNALGKIPRDLTLREVLAHPRMRALSNPVYVDAEGAPTAAT